MQQLSTRRQSFIVPSSPHVKVILEKLEASSRTEAAAIAQRKNLLKQ